MKAAASLAFSIASATSLCVGGASVASHMVAQPNRPALRVEEAPDLWTVEPRPVDLSKQRYQRLPPLLSSYAEDQLRIQLRTAKTVTSRPSTDEARTLVDSTTRHTEWCTARYRSYNAKTDTYLSFSGEKRPCISSPSDEAVSPFAASQPADDHVAWCSTRYASYRLEDDTYQPYSGSRTKCISRIARPAPEQVTASGY